MDNSLSIEAAKIYEIANGLSNVADGPHLQILLSAMLTRAPEQWEQYLSHKQAAAILDGTSDLSIQWRANA